MNGRLWHPTMAQQEPQVVLIVGDTKDKGKGGIGNVIEIVWDHVTFFNVRRVTPREEVSNEPLFPSAFMASYSSYCSASPTQLGSI